MVITTHGIDDFYRLSLGLKITLPVTGPLSLGVDLDSEMTEFIISNTFILSSEVNNYHTFSIRNVCVWSEKEMLNQPVALYMASSTIWSGKPGILKSACKMVVNKYI
jgi:hypothetical protein